IVDPDANGVFVVVGQHTYIEDGEVEVDLVDQFPVTTTINCPGMSPVTATTTAFIGEESITPAAGVVVTGKETVPLNNVVVATFSGLFSTQGEFATIDWEDGTTSTGTLSGPNQGLFTVTGSHTYAKDGENETDAVDVFTIKVTINCPSMPGVPPVVLTSQANIAEEDAPSGGAMTVTGMNIAAVQLRNQNQTSAMFTDSNTKMKPGDFTAMISWGDGSLTSKGTVTQKGGAGNPFYASARHTYKNVGTFHVITLITDPQGHRALGTSTATVTAGGGSGAALPG